MSKNRNDTADRCLAPGQAAPIESLEARTLLSVSWGGQHRADPPAGQGLVAQSVALLQASGRQGGSAPKLGSAGPLATSLASAFSTKKIGLPEFDADNFDSPVANPWFPLVPGTEYVYEAEEEDGLLTTRIIVTHDTKQVMGITAMVVREIEEIYIEELDQTFILEDTDDWFALDNDGNVWYFGEDTTSFDYDDDWNLIDTNNEGAWEAGVDGALPGILILADPVAGASYQQEFFEGEAEDEATVLRLNAKVSIDFGDFEGVLVTKESSPAFTGRGRAQVLRRGNRPDLHRRAQRGKDGDRRAGGDQRPVSLTVFPSPAPGASEV